MTKLKKISLLLAIFIILPLIFYILISTRMLFEIPHFLENIVSRVEETEIYNVEIKKYLFVIALALLVIILISIMVIVFYPTNKLSFLLNDNKGKLVVSKSAIENHVKNLLIEDNYMKNPDVTAKIFKKKIKIYVSGNLTSRSDIFNKTNEVKKLIENTISQFLGVQSKFYYDIKVSNVEKVKNKQKKSRVE